MSTTSTIMIECPSEILLELHVSEEELAGLLKETVAIDLFRQGKLSSGLAAKWAGHQISQVDFVRPARTMSQIGG